MTKLKNVANTAITLAGGAMAKIGIEKYFDYSRMVKDLEFVREATVNNYIEGSGPTELNNSFCFNVYKKSGDVFQQCYPTIEKMSSAFHEWYSRVGADNALFNSQISLYNDLATLSLPVAGAGAIIAGLGAYSLYKDWKKRKTDDEKKVDK